MQAGQAGLPETRAYMEVFRNDSDMMQVWSDCQQLFSSTRKTEKQLSAAFKRLCHYVPDMPVPVVGMHLSGFGLSIVSAPDRLSASIDKYLGPDYPYYENLFYDYQRRRMRPEQLTADYLNGWIRSEFTNESIMAGQRLLDYLKPDVVHVLIDGRIVKTGGPELATEIESRGFDWIKKELS